MLKAAGGVLVMAAGLAWGMGKRSELSKRLDRLRLVRWETASLRSRISAGSESLEEIFSKSSYFAPAAKKLALGVPADEAVMSLDGGIEGFDLFARGLTHETTEGQLRNIDIFMTSLDEELVRARCDLEKRGRLYVGVGLLTGAAIAILFA